MKENSNIHPHTRTLWQYDYIWIDDDEKILKKSFNVVDKKCIFLVLQILHPSVPKYINLKMPTLQERTHTLHTLNLHTTKIWETIVSTQRKKCGMH